MVIVDPPKDPNGPPPAPQQPLGPPPYAPLSPRGSHIRSPPPLRSPGIRPPPSPYSAPSSNFLTIKRDKADITGSWNINTSLPPPPSVARTTSADSDTSSDAGETDISSVPSAQPSSASSAGTSHSIPGSASRPNLKLFSPKGKIDAAIRVSGLPRAWLEAVSRDEDVAITFPPNTNSAPRAPIRLFARSTVGAVQVCLPNAFTGTLRVPSDTTLPPSLRSKSVVLSPSEPPVERPPIMDDSPVKTKMGLGLGRGATPAPLSPPTTATNPEPEPYVVVSPTRPSSLPAPPQLEEGVVAPSTVVPAPPSTQSAREIDTQINAAPSSPVVEGSTILAQPPVETPAQEVPPAISSVLTSPPAAQPQPPPVSPPAVIVSSAQGVQSDPSTSGTSPPSTVPPPTHSHHHRSVSASVAPTDRPMSVLSSRGETASVTSTSLTTHHNRSSSNLTTHSLRHSTSNLAIQPVSALAAPARSGAESSTVYFIGDLLHSTYYKNPPDQWQGDEIILDSEFGKVRVFAFGEKAEAGWAQEATSKMKEAVDWDRWKSGIQLSAGVPKISLGSVGKRFKWK